jgi:ATP phosphoribosyltransferase regulatory subunit
VIGRDEAARQVEAELYAALQQKDAPELDALGEGFRPETREVLAALIRMHGDGDVLRAARGVLPSWPDLTQALDTLETLRAGLHDVDVSIDLADVRGYQYHSGVMFSAYCRGLPNAVARGGRYDDVGRAFGRARPATGFSLELRELAALRAAPMPPAAIRAPWSEDAGLRLTVRELRRSGDTVIQTLPGHESDPDEQNCDRALVLRDGQWVIEPIECKPRVGD